MSKYLAPFYNFGRFESDKKGQKRCKYFYETVM